MPGSRFIATELATATTGKDLYELVFTVPDGSVVRQSNWRRAVFSRRAPGLG